MISKHLKNILSYFLVFFFFFPTERLFHISFVITETHLLWGCCCCSVTQLYPALCNAIDCSTPGFPVPHHFPEFAQVHVHCISNLSSHLILWCPLLFLPSIFSRIRDFSNESAVHIRWPKYWSFSFSISPSSECSGFISLKIDCFSLLAVFHESFSATFWRHWFFGILPSLQSSSHNCSDHWEHHSLVYMDFVDRLMSLLFSTLSRFVIAFLPRSSHLLTSWLQSPSRVILKPKKRKCVITSSLSPSICHAVMGPDAMILVF